MTAPDVHTIVRQLTEEHTHRQPYTHETDGTTWDTWHITTAPPLLDQLTQADKQPAELDLGGGTFGSKPAANLEALDVLTMIDTEAARWVRRLGGDDPGTTIACVRRLYGLAASAQFCGKPKPTKDGRDVVCCDVHRIERDLRNWWTQARVVSGWDCKPWKPNNTCPMCGVRRSLRIRVDDRHAVCVECRETWDEGNIGLLAEHVRLRTGMS